MTAPTERKPVPWYIRFPIAGISGMGAVVFVHPLDVVRYRMQLSGEGGAAADHKNWIQAFKFIYKKEGISGLYVGMSANIFHQAVYATTRMGIYQTLLDHFRRSERDNLSNQVLAAVIGGMLASTVSTPTDVAVIRMTADVRLAPSDKRNYKNVFDALRRIYIEEGSKGLYAGFRATLLKSEIQNTLQLVTYTQIKEFLISNGHMENNTKCHFVSAYVSGFVFCVAACPIDVVKTRMQYMDSMSLTPTYSGVTDALMKTVRKEGVTALWKGFFPLYARAGPHTILLFIFVEKLTYLYRKTLAEPPGSDY